MAKAAGIVLDLQDFSDLSSVTPLISRVYPNGWADVNTFQQAGGMSVFINELLQVGLLHNDVHTVVGSDLQDYCKAPNIDQGGLTWSASIHKSSNTDVLVSADQPFSSTVGLVVLNGNLGRCIVKTSALSSEQFFIRAPAQVFHDLQDAFRNDEIAHDCVCVVRFQGPQANGMPELHGLTPILSALQSKGLRVALVTDGRMSGASGKILSAIHVSPEAKTGGAISQVRNGDMIHIDVEKGIFSVEEKDFVQRSPEVAELSAYQSGCGRELFAGFRQTVGAADHGACVFFNHDY